jgi:hypothetical protein
MNNEQLMKFRLRQLEKETKTNLKKKKTLQNLIGNLYKFIMVGKRSNLIVKGKIDCSCSEEKCQCL